MTTATMIDRELIECEIDRIPDAILLDVIASEERIRHRVKRGCEALDKFMPGWQDRINLNQLRIEGCAKCVLGQLFGGYGCEPFERLYGVKVPSERRGLIRALHGFDVESGAVPVRTNGAPLNGPINREYAILGRIWTEEILDRVNHANEH